MALQEELESQGNYLFRYRGTLPILILAAGVGVFIESELNSRDLVTAYYKEVYKICCLLVSLSGLVVRIYTVGFSPENTSGRNTKHQLADSLNTTGIYSAIRHPLYLGNFLMWLGVGLLTQNVWFILVFILLYWVYYERIMFAEEQFLRKKFGDEYLVWSSKTPAIVPDFKDFVSPDYSFSWKKVLKKEKDGFFLVFFVMFLFDLLGSYLKDFSFHLEVNFWSLGLIISFFIYLLLKILKSYTSVLDETGR
jgi:protein-S-isoprenylcysteine O-methyltransferase Ste14